MTTITVGSSAALMTALKSAQGGDTILLAPGTYSGLAIKNMTFATDVKIASADPTKMAVITDMQVNTVKGLDFQNLEFLSKSGNFSFEIRNSDSVHFDHVKVHGNIDGNLTNDGSGIGFASSKNISVTNSEFQELTRGLAISDSNNVRVSGNYMHDLRSDGMDFAQVSNVKITDNTFRTFKPNAEDHPDAIQFWTSGTTRASTDIVISGNVIMRGDGEATQGIFMRDELGTLPFERVTITDNLVVGTGYNGIRIMGAKDLVVTGNELTSNPGDTNRTFLLVQDAAGVTAIGNKAVSVTFERVTKLTQSGNVITPAAADSGVMAVQKWIVAHPEDSALLTPLVPKVFVPVAGPAPVTAVAPATSVTVVATPTAIDGLKSITPTAAPAAAPTVAALEMTGTDANNVLKGDSKNNSIFGKGGNDTLDGGGGVDTLSGGTGNDTYLHSSGQATLVEKVGEGVDTVVAKGDYVLLDNFENLVINNTVSNNWAGTGNSLNNEITGSNGNNKLDGAAGNDTINGGLGSDMVIGGAGNDRLIGGAGSDTFKFAPGSGKDTIVDMGVGGARDLIDVQDFFKAGIKATLADSGANVMINFSNGDSITVLGLHASQLTANQYGWIF